MPGNQEPKPQDTHDVKRPAWTTWALIAWIAATTILYYHNFSSAFYDANQSSIQALLDKIF